MPQSAFFFNLDNVITNNDVERRRVGYGASGVGAPSVERSMAPMENVKCTQEEKKKKFQLEIH
jgi:hypothetical protein